jgi:hypothetical protein
VQPKASPSAGREQPGPSFDRPEGWRGEAGANPALPRTIEDDQQRGPGRTLETICVCAHTRRDHRGMRIEVNGSCLECDCQEFDPLEDAAESQEETMARVRAVIARVDRIQAMVARLGAAQPPSSGEGDRFTRR